MTSRRIPLLVTLLPLLAGIALYWWLWSGWAAEFRGLLHAWLPDATLDIGGFPYRMEANVASPHLTGGDAVRLDASADLARINRGPWQPELTVIAADMPVFSAAVSPGLSVRFAGKTAVSSVHVMDGRLARLSTVIEAATARLGFTGLQIAADTLELHLRERRDAAAPAASPTAPPRGQLVIAGTRLRMGSGDALTLAADLLVTGPGRLTGYDAWAKTGTIELTALSLADAHGAVAVVKATLVPVERSGLRVSGTVQTICPASVAAAFAGMPPPVEQRLRIPVRLAFEGMAGGLTLSELPADLATRPVRGQEPDCPVLRR